MEAAANASVPMAAILAGVASGDLTPIEATGVAGFVEASRKALETTELEARIKALGERTA